MSEDTSSEACSLHSSPTDYTGAQDIVEEKEGGLVFTTVLKKVRAPTDEDDNSSQRVTTTRKVRTVKAGTVERLVSYLVPDEESTDVGAYRACFLATYRTFTEPGFVVSLLIDGQKPAVESQSIAAASIEEPVQLRRQRNVLKLLKFWLENYPADFFNPIDNLAKVEVFAGSCEAHESIALKETIANVKADVNRHSQAAWIDRILHTGDTMGGQPFHLFTFQAQDMASSLTAEDARLFQAVVPHECLSYTRDLKSAPAPTVRACINHFNRISLVVIATVLEDCMVARTKAIGHWIQIAHHCRTMRNFSGLRAIVAGLQSSSVYRLHQSWHNVPQDKQLMFEELADLFQADSNHKTSRDLLAKEGTAKQIQGKKAPTAQHGVVPYLGTFLTDLTMVHTAHKDKTQDGLINFYKKRQEFEILATLTLYQKVSANYNLPHSPHLVSYRLSEQLEPTTATTSENSSIFRRSRRSPHKTTERNSKLIVLNRSTTEIGSPTHTPSPLASPSTLIVRVSISSEANCCYKSILLSESERTGAVIKSALEKHGITSSPTQYKLVQVLEDSRQVEIPDNVNVFYALASLTSPMLTLKMKESTVQ
ncbi:hypothetical protein EMCRGX_G020353 [Ephydatia muelleri]